MFSLQEMEMFIAFTGRKKKQQQQIFFLFYCFHALAPLTVITDDAKQNINVMTLVLSA